MKERAGIQSVEVGFGLLDVLGKSAGPLMLRDLAAAAGMSAAKAHRYLVSFQRLELVAQDAISTRYDLGPAALKLGLAALARIDARERGQAQLERRGAEVIARAAGVLHHQLKALEAHQVAVRLGRAHSGGGREVAQH